MTEATTKSYSKRADGVIRRNSLPGSPIRFVLGRLITLVVGVLVILALTYCVVRLVPGDPARVGTDVTATPDFIRRRRSELGLDQPFLLGLLDYYKDALLLDFGNSFVHGQPVLDLIAPRFGKTATLAIAGFLVCIVIGVPAGFAAGIAAYSGRHRVYGRIFGFTSGLFSSIPEYVIATGLVYIFSITLSLLPPSGASGWSSLILPAVALGLGTSATLARITKVEVVRVLAEDYVRTARSNRLPRRVIYGWHVLPMVLPAVLTYAGIILGSLAGGAIIVENVFAWPGVGTALVSSVMSYDYPMVQAIVALVAVISLLVNIVVDLIVVSVDPRSMVREA